MQLSDLKPDPQNRRKHTPRNLGMLADALREVGASRSIVIDETGEVLAGNGVVEAASTVGLSKVQVVEADGETIVAVRRRGLTVEQKRALALYDNRVAELAEWNWDQLGADQVAGLTLEPWFTDAELAAGLKMLKTGLTDPDEAPEIRPTSILRGDLFELGVHRLLCGDATSPGDVARLCGNIVPFVMVTDPPYGVDYDPEWRLATGLNKPHQKCALGDVTNDDQADWRLAWSLFSGDVAYVWHGGVYASIVQAGLVAADLIVRAQIIWAKPVFVIGRGAYHWQHEPCWYAVRRNANAKWMGDRKQSTLWQIANMHATQGEVDDGKTDHSTQKPVECMRRPMQHHGVATDWFYDPFCGSGTTIIAAEQVARQCLAIDIEPSYVQMTIDRWEAFTGQRAQKVGEAVR